MSDRKATLTLDGREYDLPVLKPTIGPDVVDKVGGRAERDSHTRPAQSS